jgi:hypothetical protein
MAQAEFTDLIKTITADIAGKSLDQDLMGYMNERYSPQSDEFKALVAQCREGVRDGWLCDREMGGIKFGRIIKQSDETQGFSVDVVEMNDIVGPHHRHPNGEIDMVIPEDEGAEFDHHGEGWVVYGPDSAHKPTVTGGKAIVLYLLPDGAIDFS